MIQDAKVVGMGAASARVLDLNTVPLENAVFCVNCEMISNSMHDVCTVCGSPSLVGLFRILGGTLRERNGEVEKPPTTVKYHVELSVDAHNISARDLNHTIDLVTHLSKAGGIVEHMHINVESVFEEVRPPLLRAA
jgi:hypothetical protein